MYRWMRPGILLINRLTYPRKFALISALLVVPLVLAIVLLLSETNPRVAFTEQERIGVTYLRVFRPLIEHVVQNRALAHQYLTGDSAVEAQLRANMADVDNAMTALAAVDQQYGTTLGTRGQRQQLTSDWRALRDQLFAMNPQTSALQHTHVLEGLQALLQHVDNTSNLILDPEFVSYYLMDSAFIRLPERIEILAQAQLRGLDTDYALRVGSLQPEFAGLASRLDINLQATKQGMDTAFKQDAAVAQRLQAPLAANIAASTRVGDALTWVATDPDALSTKRAELTNLTALSTSFALWDLSTNALDEALQQRVNQLVRKNTLATGIALVLLVVVLYLLVAFYQSVMQTVRVLDRAAQQMQRGEVAGAITLDNYDELGQVASSFNTVAAALVTASAERHVAQAAQTRLQEEIIRTQSANLAFLSVPLIPLSSQVMLLPLIGIIDAQRAEQMLNTLLNSVYTHRTRMVILDLTGLADGDSIVAATLTQVARAVRLLGADVVITGMHADVAQALIENQAALQGITIYRTLEDGIAHVAPRFAPGFDRANAQV